MAQINLLRQKPSSSNFWRGFVNVAVKLLVAILLLVGAYYGWLFFRIKDINGQIAKAQQSIADTKQQASQIEGRDEVLTRQQQVQELEKLISSHLYWSRILPELAKITLKSATYLNIKVLAEGDMVLSVNLPSMEELDKFLQVFEQPKFLEKFSDVSIGTFYRVPNGEDTEIRFDVKLKYDTSLLALP